MHCSYCELVEENYERAGYPGRKNEGPYIEDGAEFVHPSCQVQNRAFNIEMMDGDRPAVTAAWREFVQWVELAGPKLNEDGHKLYKAAVLRTSGVA